MILRFQGFKKALRMHKCLGRYGYAVNKTELTAEQEKSLKNGLTVTTEVLPAYKDFQKPKVYKLYLHNSAQYFLPRFYGESIFGPPEYNGLTDGKIITVACPQAPLPHQHGAIDKLFRIFDRTKALGDGGVLQLPCGYGKTYCAIKTVCHLGLMALIIVPTECLMDQWAEAILKMTDGKARIGIIQQDRMEVKNCDFVIAMLHSLCLKDYPPDLFVDFGITVFDECHHIGSETFSKAMMRVRTRFVLGLSATPVRRDGLSSVFHHFLGPLFHSEKRTGSNSVTVKKIRLNSTAENYNIVRMANGTKCTSAMTTNISKFTQRNDLILLILKQVIAQGRKVLVLSSRKEHLHDLKKRLDGGNFRTVEGAPVSSGFYYGKSGMNRKEHKKILSESAQCDIVLGIDVIAKEGLDIPDLNTLIFATPAGMEIEQPVGRILRKFHKTLPPLVFDLVDNTGNYIKHSTERDKWYTDEGYAINELVIELDTPEDKSEMIRDFIHNKQKVVKRVTRGQKEKDVAEPAFDACVLDLPDEEVAPLKTTLKTTLKKKKIQQQPIPTVSHLNLSTCHLDNYCSPDTPEPEKFNINKCMLD
jgi:superfamily II DNA or RNA helicase